MDEIPDIDVLKASIANFATKGFSQFRLRLNVTRRTERRSHQVRAVILKESDPVDFKILRIKGKGTLAGIFLAMDAYGVLLPGESALRSKFKLDYTMEFTKKRDKSVLSNAYPAFLPNWMSQVPLFNAINLCILRYEARKIALDIDCTPVKLKTDGTADVHVRGVLDLSSFHDAYEIKEPFEMTVTGCAIEMVKVELAQDRFGWG